MNLINITAIKNTTQLSPLKIRPNSTKFGEIQGNFNPTLDRKLVNSHKDTFIFCKAPQFFILVSIPDFRAIRRCCKINKKDIEWGKN